jgi:hypothetical protein
MDAFHVKAVRGIILGWFEVCNDSDELQFSIEPHWWWRSMRIRDYSRQHIGDVIPSWTMLIWPEVIRFEWRGTALLKVRAHRFFGRSEYELTLPDGKPLRVVRSFRKIHLFRGDQEVATAAKKLFSRAYRVEVNDLASAEFLLVTVALLGSFGD